MNENYPKEGLSQDSEISSILSQETMKILELNCDDYGVPFTPSNSCGNYQTASNYSNLIAIPSLPPQQSLSSYDTEILDDNNMGTDHERQRIEFEASVHRYQPVWYNRNGQAAMPDFGYYPPPNTINHDINSNNVYPTAITYYNSNTHMLPPVTAKTQNDDVPEGKPYDDDSLIKNSQAILPQEFLSLHQMQFSEGLNVPESLPFTPSNRKFLGIHDFSILFHQNGANNSDFIYSSRLNKLYVKQDTSCLFRFQIRPSPMMKSHQTLYRLRALPIFKELDQCHIPVSACPLHPNSDIHRRSYASNHLILSDDLMAAYEFNPLTKRRSLTVSIMLGDSEADNSVSVPFKFACFSSCIGGINRRQLQIVFTLEHGNEIIGRTSVDVRICAAPLRDIKKDETLNDPKKKKEYLTKEINTRGGFKRARLSNNSFNSESSPLSTCSTLSEPITQPPPTYTIIVTDHDLYELLKRVRDSYKLCETGANNHLKQFLLNCPLPQPINLTTDTNANHNCSISPKNSLQNYTNGHPNCIQPTNQNALLNLSSKETAMSIYQRSIKFDIKCDDEMNISLLPKSYIRGIIDDLVFWTRDFGKIKNAYSLSLPSSLSSETSTTDKNSSEAATPTTDGLRAVPPLVEKIKQPFWPLDFSYIVYKYRFRHSISLLDSTINGK